MTSPSPAPLTEAEAAAAKALAAAANRRASADGYGEYWVPEDFAEDARTAVAAARGLLFEEAAQAALARCDWRARGEAYESLCNTRHDCQEAAGNIRMAVAEMTPCDSWTPCNVDGSGEPCDTHERLYAHAEDEHELCGPECAARQSLSLPASKETQNDH